MKIGFKSALMRLPTLCAFLFLLSTGYVPRAAHAAGPIVSGTSDSSGALFQSVIEDVDPAQTMDFHFDRIVRMHYRTQSYLEAFDQNLDRLGHGDSALVDPSYARLLAARILMEEASSQASETYFKLRNLAADPAPGESFDATRQERAKIALEGFKAALVKNGRGVRKLALQDVYRDLLEESDPANLTGSVGAMTKHLKQQLFSDVSSLNQFYLQHENEFKQQAIAAKSDQQITAEIEALAPEIEATLVTNFTTPRGVDFTGRSPVAPGSGATGTMNGGTFSNGVWMLTYDDGPGPLTTTVLNNLTNHGMKTTFFWLAKSTPSFQATVDRARSLGMILGNHSYSHANLPTLGAAALQKEIVESSRIDSGVYGFAPKFFRCPYGSCGANGSAIRQMIANQGMIQVNWNVDSLDWQDHNPNTVAERVRKQMRTQSHGIILFHDVHPQSVEATRMLMDEWKPKVAGGSMRLLNVQEAVNELNSPNGMPGAGER